MSPRGSRPSRTKTVASSGGAATSTATRPSGGPDGSAHVTVGDLLRFHRSVSDGRLLGPALTAELLLPKARYSKRGAGKHLNGFRLRVRDGCGCHRPLLLEGRCKRRSQRHAPPLPDEGHHLRRPGRRRAGSVGSDQGHRRSHRKHLIRPRGHEPGLGRSHRTGKAMEATHPAGLGLEEEAEEAHAGFEPPANRRLLWPVYTPVSCITVKKWTQPAIAGPGRSRRSF